MPRPTSLAQYAARPPARRAAGLGGPVWVRRRPENVPTCLVNSSRLARGRRLDHGCAYKFAHLRRSVRPSVRRSVGLARPDLMATARRAVPCRTLPPGPHTSPAAPCIHSPPSRRRTFLFIRLASTRARGPCVHDTRPPTGGIRKPAI